ncbi:MAG: fumarylacetoacetate hydrolase family protein [Candidatus Eremiobacteraeota bacterium]|nr:fumarylacetoacetate hydrolase family protein [Candidatus Eremiobacteraeota bacterium]
MSTIRRSARCLIDGTAREGTIEDDAFIYTGGHASLASVTFLPPCIPSKIIGIGRNYADHAAELANPLPAEPLLFFKPSSALNHHNGAVTYPVHSQRVDYEGELGVVIGVRCKAVPRSRAHEVIMGYTICNDFTARDLQRTDGQWARAKGFDGFAPIGPCIASGIEPSGLRLRTRLNGVVKQDATTASLVFDVPALVEYVSAAFTLEPGDVISTGTPAGVGPVQPGDVVEVEIESIGVLRNTIVAPG